MAGLQTVLYSLAAQLYPVSIRVTGVGAAGTVVNCASLLAPPVPGCTCAGCCRCASSTGTRA